MKILMFVILICQGFILVIGNNMRKLIRNKIPNFIMGERDTLLDHENHGLRRMTEWEYPYALQLKLHEEWAEAWASPSAEELGDCLQVLKDTAEYMGIEWKQVETAMSNKEEQRGGFNQRWELRTK